MKAVILAGGKGTRLMPLTENRPKPLIPVVGLPCIDYVIRSLVDAGFKKIIITTGYMSDTLIQSIGDGARYNASILYSFEEEAMGTAGAIRKVGAYLDDTFVVASGDVLADVDIRSLYNHHKSKKALATMALTEVDNPTEFGIVGLDDDGLIVRFKEKPKKEEVFSNLINAGIYVLEPSVLDYIPENTKYDFSRQVFPAILKDKLGLHGKAIPGLWRDIGRPSDLLGASIDVIKRTKQKSKPFEKRKTVKVTGKVLVGKNVKVGDKVSLKGPCYIGDNVKIGNGSIVSSSCLYSNVDVDKDTKINGSILLENAYLGSSSEVKDSIIGRGCRVEEDVEVVDSIIGDLVTLNKHSRILNANIFPSRS